MAEILGKVTAPSSADALRGADVALRVSLPPSWLNEGQCIEVELPRNLLCARCYGGGCGSCNQSGAITLRGRTELPEFVQVVLPMQKSGDPSQSMRLSGDAAPNSERAPESQPTSVRPVTIRIPECGGLPDLSKGELTRGWLYLEIGLAATPSPNVRRLSEFDDPVSSANMLRAAVRRSSKRVTGGLFVPTLEDTVEPPSSRVARAGSTKPPSKKAQVISNTSGQLIRGQESDVRGPLRRASRRGPAKLALYAAAMVLLAASLIAAWALL
ncbi:MAG TPA: hypothetical protein VIV60_36340 [Polyangiaceae bacterium]